MVIVQKKIAQLLKDNLKDSPKKQSLGEYERLLENVEQQN